MMASKFYNGAPEQRDTIVLTLKNILLDPTNLTDKTMSLISEMRKVGIEPEELYDLVALYSWRCFEDWKVLRDNFNNQTYIKKISEVIRKQQKSTMLPDLIIVESNMVNDFMYYIYNTFKPKDAKVIPELSGDRSDIDDDVDCNKDDVKRLLQLGQELGISREKLRSRLDDFCTCRENAIDNKVIRKLIYDYHGEFIATFVCYGNEYYPQEYLDHLNAIK